MDHAIEYLTEYAVTEAEDLKKEYDSGEYVSPEQCPDYEKIKAYADAINRLMEYYEPEGWMQTPERLAGIYNVADGDEDISGKHQNSEQDIYRQTADR